MGFEYPPIHRERLIEYSGDNRTDFKTGFVAKRLQDLANEGRMEIVPDSLKQDEQGMGCEAIFRHHNSGCYLGYARYGCREQLDLMIPGHLDHEKVGPRCKNDLREKFGDVMLSS